MVLKSEKNQNNPNTCEHEKMEKEGAMSITCKFGLIISKCGANESIYLAKDLISIAKKQKTVYFTFRNMDHPTFKAECLSEEYAEALVDDYMKILIENGKK